MATPKPKAEPRIAKAIMTAVMNLAVTTATVNTLRTMLLPASAIVILDYLDSPPASLLLQVIVHGIIGTLAFILTPDMALLIIELISSMFFDISGKQHRPTFTTTSTCMLRTPVPTPLSDLALLVATSPFVVFVGAVFLPMAARTLCKMRRLGRAFMDMDLWLLGLAPVPLDDIHLWHWAPSTDFLSNRLEHIAKSARRGLVKASARSCRCLRSMETSTQRRRSQERAAGSLTLMAWSMSMLMTPGHAAPLNATAESSVTCIVTNATLATLCPFDTSSSSTLSPEAQGLIALGVVTVVLTVVLVVFGVPEWANHRLHAIWTWARELCRPCPDSDLVDGERIAVARAVGDEDTVNATAGDTDGAVADRPLRRLFRFFEPSSSHDSPHVPVPHSLDQRNEILACVGAALDYIPAEWPLNFEEEGLELQQLSPAALSFQERAHDVDAAAVVMPAEPCHQHGLGSINPSEPTASNSVVIPDRFGRPDDRAGTSRSLISNVSPQPGNDTTTKAPLTKWKPQ